MRDLTFLWHVLLRIEPCLLTGAVEILGQVDSMSLYVYVLEYDACATANLICDYSSLYPFQGERMLQFAAVHGCLRVAYLLRMRGRPGRYRPTREFLQDDDSSSLRAQAVLRMNLAPRYDYPEDVIYAAVGHGDIHTVQWLHKAMKQYNFLTAIKLAAKSGKLATAQWLAFRAHEVNSWWASKIDIEVMVLFDEELSIFV